MINYKRVQRIKTMIYIVGVLLLILPLILMVLVCVNMMNLANTQKQVAEALADVNNTVNSAAVSFDRAIASYKAPAAQLPDYSIPNGEKNVSLAETDQGDHEDSNNVSPSKEGETSENDLSGAGDLEPEELPLIETSKEEGLSQGGTGDPPEEFSASSSNDLNDYRYVTPPLTGK